ncbi:hypothetical protein PIB30_052894 [Stylosanthes scabra]|uniref:RNase H type-1 domain-containing protein n=1 Tax=Stylosanthes scabra TaxID=79078 RepID=A0ABU6RIQ6_9FABA|nr:hypothetical protein [Stylosanthes scabra]
MVRKTGPVGRTVNQCCLRFGFNTEIENLKTTCKQNFRRQPPATPLFILADLAFVVSGFLFKLQEGIVKGLQLAGVMNLNRVIIESDSVMAISFIKNVVPPLITVILSWKMLAFYLGACNVLSGATLFVKPIMLIFLRKRAKPSFRHSSIDNSINQETIAHDGISREKLASNPPTSNGTPNTATQNPLDSNKSQSQGSSDLRGKTYPTWVYVALNVMNGKTQFCVQIFGGVGIHRMKKHLTKVPEQVDEVGRNFLQVA